MSASLWSRRLAPLIAIAMFAVLPVMAGAAIGVTILNADKVRSSIDDADEVETFSIDCPAGAKFSASVKGKKDFQPTLRVFAPDATQPFADAVVQAGKGSKLKVAELPQSGTYVVEVSGRGGSTGEYKLKVTWKSPKKESDEIETAPEPTAFPFAAGAGTRVNVKAVAVKGSAATPELVRIEGPDEYVLDLRPPSKAASDDAKKIVLPANGDYTLFVRDAGATGGTVNASISFKQAKASKRSVDIRASVIGNSAGEQFALSDVLGTGGGAVVVPFAADGEDPISVIAGSGVAVPAGALTAPTSILVATSSDVIPKNNDIGAGPSVFFGPEGLTFKEAVTVTIPFDTATFGGDLSRLVIYTRDARGKVRAVPGPYDVDPTSGTVSFPVSHFSSFRAARETPRGGGNDFRLVGVWRNDDEPSTTSFIIIPDDGPATFVTVDVQTGDCSQGVLFTVGLDLSLAFQIVDGNLTLVGGESSAPTYTPSNSSEFPPLEDCQDVFAGVPAK